MNWNSWIRQVHRWVSIAFTVTVAANFSGIVMGWAINNLTDPIFLKLFLNRGLILLWDENAPSRR